MAMDKQLLLPIVSIHTLLSLGSSVTTQVSPDIVYRHLTQQDATKWRILCNLLDSRLALLRLASIPVSGYILDTFGPRQMLLATTLSSAAARLLAAAFPDSPAAFQLFRAADSAAFVPSITAASLLFADVSGGRASPEYVKNARNVFIFLALFRAAATKIAGNPSRSSRFWLILAAFSSILAAGITYSVVGESKEFLAQKETERKLQERDKEHQLQLLMEKEKKAEKGRGAPITIARPVSSEKTLVDEVKKIVGRILLRFFIMYRTAFSFFLKDEPRKALALLLLIRSVPSQLTSYLLEHQRFNFRWGSEERATLGAVQELASVLLPLAVANVFKTADSLTKNFQPQDSAKLSLRLSALSLLNTAITPIPNSVLINPLIENVIPGNGNEFYDKCFTQILASSASVRKGGSSASQQSLGQQQEQEKEKEKELVNYSSSLSSFTSHPTLPSAANSIAENQLQVALELLLFPLSFYLPTTLNSLFGSNTTLPLLFVAGLSLVGSEYAVDNVVKKLQAPPPPPSSSPSPSSSPATLSSSISNQNSNH